MANSVTTKLVYIDLDLIDPHPKNPRLFEDPDFVSYLTAEIQRNGYPEHYAGLFRIKHDGRYQSLSAHRRVQASRAAGLLKIPGWVGDIGDEEALLELSKSNMQHGLSKLELAVHSLQIEKASGRRGLGLKGFAQEHKLDHTALSRYRRGAEVFVEVRSALNQETANGCQARCEHLARIQKAPRDAWAALVERCVNEDWSIGHAEREVATLSTIAAGAGPATANGTEAVVVGGQDRAPDPRSVSLASAREHSADDDAPVAPGLAVKDSLGDVDVDDRNQEGKAVEVSVLELAELQPSAASEEQQAPDTALVPPPVSMSDGGPLVSEAPMLAPQAESSDHSSEPAVDPTDTQAVTKKLGEFWARLPFKNRRSGFISLWLDIVQEIGDVQKGPVLQHLMESKEPAAVGNSLRSVEAIVALILSSANLTKEVEALRDLARCFGTPAEQVAETVPVPTSPASPAASIKGVVKAKPRAKAKIVSSKKAKRHARA